MNNLPEQSTKPDIAAVVLTVRDQRVILDADLASLYGVTVKRLNEQYRRNLGRFPEDFAFQITPEEWAAVRARFAASGKPMNRSQLATGLEPPGLKSQIATSSFAHGGRRKLPIAFTEHGALMAANILNSPRAATMSVYVIRAFVRMRQEQAANTAILKRLAEIDKNLLLHDTALRDIYQKLRPLLEPPPAPPKPEIGFHVKEGTLPYRIRRKLAAT
jgi:hypothetical protein